MTVLPLSTGTPTELDPKPWVGPSGQRYRKEHKVLSGALEFAPRPQYSQSLSAYEDGTK